MNMNIFKKLGKKNLFKHSEEKRYSYILIAQFVSQFGNSLTGFAFGVWLFLSSHRVADVSYLYFFQILPGVLFSIPAGFIVDRFSRKKIVILSDVISALFLSCILLTFIMGNLSAIDMYLYISVYSILNTLQSLSLSSLISVKIRSSKKARFNILMDLRKVLPRLLGPVVAGTWITSNSLVGLLIFDILSYGVSSMAIYILCDDWNCKIANKKSNKTRMGDLVETLKYIREKPILMRILSCMMTAAFSLSLLGVYIIPIILHSTTPNIFGIIMGIGGLGAFIGGIIFSIFSAKIKRIFYVVPISVCIQGMFLALIGLSRNISLLACSLFFYFFMMPVQNSSSYTTWQIHVKPEIHGKVFALKGIALQITTIFVFLLAGTFADKLLTPLFVSYHKQTIIHMVSVIFGRSTIAGMAFTLTVVGVIQIIMALYNFIKIYFEDQNFANSIMVSHGRKV